MSGMFSQCDECCDNTLEGKWLATARPWTQFFVPFDTAALAAYSWTGGESELPSMSGSFSSIVVSYPIAQLLMATRYLKRRIIITSNLPYYDDADVAQPGGTDWTDELTVTFDPHTADSWTNSSRDGVRRSGTPWRSLPSLGIPDWFTRTRTFGATSCIQRSETNFGYYQVEVKLEQPITWKEQADAATPPAPCSTESVTAYLAGVETTIPFTYVSGYAAAGAVASAGILLVPRSHPDLPWSGSGYTTADYYWTGDYNATTIPQEDDPIEFLTKQYRTTMQGFLTNATTEHYNVPAWMHGQPATLLLAHELLSSGFWPTFEHQSGGWRAVYATDASHTWVTSLQTCWTFSAGYGCGITGTAGLIVQLLDETTSYVQPAFCEPLEITTPGSQYNFSPSDPDYIGIAWHNPYSSFSLPLLHGAETVPDCCEAP